MNTKCLVLVGAGDIAVASALDLWDLGYGRVYVMTRGTSTVSREAVVTLTEAGYDVVPLSCDVSDWQSLAAAAATVDVQVDALVYSPAGERVFKTLDELSQEQWDRSYDLFVGGLVGTVKALLPRIGAGTSVVALSGTSARAIVSNKHLAMGSAKAALEQAIPYLADALAERGARVNAVSCGPVETSSTRGTMDEAGYERLRDWQTTLTTPGRLAQPCDVGRVVSALCSPGLEWVNGQVLLADGGALGRSATAAGTANPLSELLSPQNPGHPNTGGSAQVTGTPVIEVLEKREHDGRG